MLRPGKDCRLHLLLGKPWKEALGSLEREGVSDDLWYWVGALDTGDVLLTALDTRPRMFAVIERAAKPTTSRSKWLDIDQFERFPLLVSVAAVEERMGGRMPRIPGPVPKDLTAALLDAVEAELTSRTPEVAREGRRCASSSRMRSTGLQAQALTASGGYCAACERDFGALLKGEGYAALEVHHRTPLADSPDEEVETTVDQLVVVCGACHNLLHGASRPSLEALRYAWREACPECDAHTTQRILWGLPVQDPETDVHVGGCNVPSSPSQWHCATCQYEWATADEPSPEQVGYDFRLLLRSHWPAPRLNDHSHLNFGSNNFLIAMSRTVLGYRAESWAFDDGIHDDVDPEVSEVESIVEEATLAQMCRAVQLFLERTLLAEGLDPTSWR